MTFTEAIQEGFRKYAEFSGRSPRSGYWWWALFNALVSIAAQVVDLALGSGQALQALTGLALLLPGLAVGARRMHDVDKSGWNLLWSLTIVGIIYVIYLAVKPGTDGPNRYGDNPLPYSAPATA